ncbi:MAG: hypothetical protein JXA13_08075 [Anaerolineales bacterium]|nr:hypothetical protein [Anaerolineales bacterium]
MVDKTSQVSKTNKRRLPKGLRTHIRRMKQAAHKEGTIYRPDFIRRTPEKTSGK